MHRPIQLLINRNEKQTASGTLFIDNDGLSQGAIDNGTYEYYSIQHKSSKSLMFQML